LGGVATFTAHSQSAPPSSEHVWHTKGERDLSQVPTSHADAAYAIDPAKIYNLADLIDLAQMHNPDTRIAWQEAKAKAAVLGIARGALYPTIAAVALAETARQASLIGEFFHRQTLGVFEPVLHV